MRTSFTGYLGNLTRFSFLLLVRQEEEAVEERKYRDHFLERARRDAEVPPHLHKFYKFMIYIFACFRHMLLRGAIAVIKIVFKMTPHPTHPVV